MLEPPPFTSEILGREQNKDLLNWFNSIQDVINKGEPPSKITEITGSIGIRPSGKKMRLISSGTGNMPITVNPQITFGSYDGQELLLEGIDNTRTVELDDGDGLQLEQSNYRMGEGDILKLQYNAVRKIWVELFRSKK